MSGYYPMSMYCQKCRSPLQLDSSLEALNPAAFDLLVDSTGKLPADDGLASTKRPQNYSQDRKSLYDRAASRATSPTHRRSIQPPKYGPSTQSSPVATNRSNFKHNGDMSFIMLTESQVTPPVSGKAVQANLSSPYLARHETQEPQTGQVAPPASKNLSFEVERANELFSIISARSDIDHPICAECADLLLSSLTNRLQSATKERDAYIGFLKQLNHSIPSEEELASTQATLEKAKKLESSLFDELLKLEAEKERLEASLGELEEESRALDIEENEFWQSRNTFTEKLSEVSSERSALHSKYVHDTQQLERLQRSNVYNDTFCIGHDGLFGTINGLRLGRLPNQMVEWSEINAAWGLTLLCLATVAEKLAFEFQGYRIRPMGSTSRIDKLDYAQHGQQSHPSAPPRNQTTPSKPPRSPPTKIIPLDLFSSGDLPLGRMFTHRRFDAGMVAFLDCLAQLSRHVEHTSRHAPNRTAVRLPYDIKGEKIGDVSIKLGAGFQQDENWTKACKYALTCCKFLLAHASNLREGRDRGKGREKEQDRAPESGKGEKAKKRR